MAWILTPAMTAQRNAFNQRFPSRRKASDGTIGDAAHKLSPSSHNPDDTAGSKSEYSDADTKQEVRATDTDENLNDPAADMFDVVYSILNTPADLRRCRYLILHDTIWSANGDWTPRRYTGEYHNHLHTSGNPDTDDDGSPWQSILNLGGRKMELGTPVPEPLYSDYNGPDKDDAPTGLTVGQMMAQTHQHAWYARSAANKALEIAKASALKIDQLVAAHGSTPQVPGQTAIDISGTYLLTRVEEDES